MVKNKQADLAELRSQLVTSQAEGLALRKKLDSQARVLEDSDSRVAQANKEQERLKAGLMRTEKELDSLRNLMAARRSEEAQRAEAESSREKELLALREQLARFSKQSAGELETARKALSDLEAKHGAATTELERIKTEKAKSEAEWQVMAQKLGNHEALVKSAEAVKRGLDSDLTEARHRLIQQQAALAEVTCSRDASIVRLVSCTFLIQFVL